MVKIYYCLLISTFLLAPLALGEQGFQKSWDQEDKSGFSATDVKFLADKHVIFIAGVMNELTDFINNYFPDNMKAAQRFGATYSYIGPSSALSIPDNAALLYQSIKKIAEKVQKPIILVGHSKGGAEILHLLLEHPDLILNGSIDRALLIQPAIGGSAIADNASGLFYSVVALLFEPNMNTLSTTQAQVTFNKAFELYRAQLKVLAKKINYKESSIHEHISSRIFYVRSRTTSEISFGLKLVLGVMQDSADRYCTEHDGLLSVEAQLDKRIGIDLGVVDADHIDLTVSKVSNMSKARREAFTRAAFKSMYDKPAYSIFF